MKQADFTFALESRVFRVRLSPTSIVRYQLWN